MISKRPAKKGQRHKHLNLPSWISDVLCADFNILIHALFSNSIFFQRNENGSVSRVAGYVQSQCNEYSYISWAFALALATIGIQA